MIETPLSSVRVVFVRPEPLCFEVPKFSQDGLALSFDRASPSLKYKDFPIYSQQLLKELVEDTGVFYPSSPSLHKWAKQGILLWNFIPTVKRNFPLSHVDWGWDDLSIEMLWAVYRNNPKTVFIDWGTGVYNLTDILGKGAIIIEGTGPFRLDTKDWYGTKPFSRINALLKETHQREINWRL